MFDATTRIAQALFDALRTERNRKPEAALKFDGVDFSDQPPGWFAVVDFLADALKGGEADSYSASTDLIALIQVAMRDCDRAIAKEREKGPHRKESWIELLNQQRVVLFLWLKNRDLLPKHE